MEEDNKRLDPETTELSDFAREAMEGYFEYMNDLDYHLIRALGEYDWDSFMEYVREYHPHAVHELEQYE